MAPGQKRRRWVEPVTALLMALATLATAWCSYESAAWTRRSNRLLNEYNALDLQAGLLSLQGIQTATIHTAMFMQLLAAKEAGNDRLAKFYAERFPADVWKAYDGWLAQKSFENPNADPHPFVPNLYEVRGTREAADASTKAAGVLEESRSAGNVSGQYLSKTVLFAWFSSLPAPQGSSSSGASVWSRSVCCGRVRLCHSADGDAPP